MKEHIEKQSNKGRKDEKRGGGVGGREEKRERVREVGKRERG